MSKRLLLASKQNNINVTSFHFKDYETGSEFVMRMFKSDPAHDEWSTLKEGDKFTITVSPLAQEETETAPEAQPE